MQGDRAILIASLRTIFAGDPSRGKDKEGAWEQAWKQGITPWDSKSVQPALQEIMECRWELLEELKHSDLKRGKVLVAGCGTGYDVVYFARQGFQSVLGIDLSPTAVSSARRYLESLDDAPTNVDIRQADFFQFDPQLSKFALAYDYTFFCALAPEFRTLWGQRYADLIESGGVLLTFIYPIDGDRESGPPFSVSFEAYENVLTPSFSCIYSEVPSQTRTDDRNREIMSVWLRK